jgi:hypothetical protein
MIWKSTTNDFGDSAFGGNIRVRHQIRNSLVSYLKTLMKIACEDFSGFLCSANGDIVRG